MRTRDARRGSITSWLHPASRRRNNLVLSQYSRMRHSAILILLPKAYAKAYLHNPSPYLGEILLLQLLGSLVLAGACSAKTQPNESLQRTLRFRHQYACNSIPTPYPYRAVCRACAWRRRWGAASRRRSWGEGACGADRVSSVLPSLRRAGAHPRCYRQRPPRTRPSHCTPKSQDPMPLAAGACGACLGLASRVHLP